jgi:hypothetical protein
MRRTKPKIDDSSRAFESDDIFASEASISWAWKEEHLVDDAVAAVWIEGDEIHADVGFKMKSEHITTVTRMSVPRNQIDGDNF